MPIAGPGVKAEFCEISGFGEGRRRIVKDGYWRWPERNLAGNAIDFHVQILGMSFHDAMQAITGC